MACGFGGTKSCCAGGRSKQIPKEHTTLIGVPHGPPSANGPFSPATPGGVVPPLSGLFPSFGRTLTAEEQNNLERRKQEEQFAMAQQREVMMRQQAITRIQPGEPT
ncbi:hypothetical protein HYQ44_007538 [Verticillium longisporum]|nr:hypothetical protein HYQ44_007538 [Verticillium longisporum]